MQAAAELLGVLGEQEGVDQHAGALHLLQHRQHRQLDVAVERGEPRLGLELRPQVLVQAQRDVGVLGGVFGGALDRDIKEADLLGALAAHLGVGQRRQAEMAAGERIHVVRLVAFEHVGFEQGVVGDAAQRDAVVGEHVGVVFQVLAELGVGVGFQPGPQLVQHLGQRQLLGRFGAAVRQRQVGGFARFDGEGDADQLRGHRVEAGGLGVEGGEFGGGDPRQPGVEGGPVENREVAAAMRTRLARRIRLVRLGGRGAEAAILGRRLRGVDARRLPAVEVLQPRAELEALVQRAQGGLVVLARGQFLELHRQLEVGDDGDQLAPERQELEVLAQVLADLAAHLVGVGDEAVEVAELGEPLHRGLGAALLHPGHVVHRVPHQRQVVDDALGRHAELGLDAGDVEHLLVHRVDPLHPGAHQLGEVLVAGRDHHLPAALERLAGQRADDVVRLHPLDRQQRPALRLHRLVQRLDLGAQVVGHRRPVRLVFRVPVVAEGLALGIEDAGAEFCLVVAFEPT